MRASLSVLCTVLCLAACGSGGNGGGEGGSVAFESGSYAVEEGEGAVVLSITRAGGFQGAVSISWAAEADTAIAGEDFTAASGTLSWADGEEATKTVEVAIIDDTLPEEDESLTLALTDPQGGVTVGAQATATVTISHPDAYQGLRELEVGEIKCSGDSCCFRRCIGNNDIICMSRNPEEYMGAFDPPFPGCEALVLPEWFFGEDCFLWTESWNARTDQWYDEPAQGPEVNTIHGFTFFPSMQCFCGRTDSAYAGTIEVGGTFSFADCETGVARVEPTPVDFTCETDCGLCTPSCGARECGSDGCGGSCGTCTPPNDSCSAVGRCVAGTSGDTCSNCLSACRGLPGCCTGCGCVCEDACGGCF